MPGHRRVDAVRHRRADDSARLRRTLPVACAVLGGAVVTIAILSTTGVPGPDDDRGEPQQEAMVAYGPDVDRVPDPQARNGPFSPRDDDPAVRNLDPALLAATTRAFDDAATSGVALEINSGWRSRAAQQVLLDQAVVEHGSMTEALRWVATPDASHHTTGSAIDVGPAADTDWLDVHGHRFGLCRTYDNEAWHFELVTRPGTPCPPRSPSAAEGH